MASEHLSVTWDNFHKNMSSGMNSLLQKEDFVDVTLAVEGRYLKAHKMVLSVCSPYFTELFKTTPCKHPIVFMKDVSFEAMSDLLQFMYKGEVQVTDENFNQFIKTAESLQIKGLRGLSGYGNNSSSVITESQHEENKSKSQHSEEVLPTPSPKRTRLNEPIPMDQEIVKPEPEEAAIPTVSSLDEEQISFKSEPCEELVGDDSNGNFPDDPLRNCSSFDDFGIDDDDYDDDDTSNGIVKGDDMEDASPSDVEGATSSGLLIAEKSKRTYQQTFVRFEQWCTEKNFKTINENVLVTYFKEKSVNFKSSTLMASYSMLRTMLSIKNNIDISKYRELTTFLKRKSEGYKAKKSEVFKREDFERFLREANDEIYLMLKVALIIGIAGALRREELTYLLMENVIDEGDIIRVQLPEQKKNRISREFIITAGNIEDLNLVEIIRKYMKLRLPRTNHQRFFVCYRRGMCTKQPIGINKFGVAPKSIARFLGLPNYEQYTGHCFRRTAATLKLEQGVKRKSLVYCSL